MGDYPAQWLAQMRGMLGDEYPAFVRALSEQPERALRLNPARPGAARWLGERAGARVAWAAQGRYVAGELSPGRDIAHFAGGYYMQDASAMAAAAVLDAKPGERALDLCAAPGGKSGQIAAALAGRGALVANEPDAARAKILSANLERLGVGNCAVVSAYPGSLAALWPDYFDAVLVDAPCSGEGMFRRDERARSEWSPERAAGCAARQAEILAAAARMVAPGGRLVYSTCTFNRAENEENVLRLLAKRPDFSPASFALPGVGASEGGCIRLWPHRARGEGHFVAALVRAGNGRGEKADPPGKPASREAENALSDLLRCLGVTRLGDFGGWKPELRGGALWLTPPGLPDLSGVKALRAGLKAGELRKGRVEPDHALAMAALLSGDVPRADLTPDAARFFAAGEAVPSAVTGWAVAVCEGLPLGWGKGSGGILKNHIPKGIRMGCGT